MKKGRKERGEEKGRQPMDYTVFDASYPRRPAAIAVGEKNGGGEERKKGPFWSFSFLLTVRSGETRGRLEGGKKRKRKEKERRSISILYAILSISCLKPHHFDSLVRKRGRIYLLLSPFRWGAGTGGGGEKGKNISLLLPSLFARLAVRRKKRKGEGKRGESVFSHPCPSRTCVQRKKRGKKKRKMYRPIANETVVTANHGDAPGQQLPRKRRGGGRKRESYHGQNSRLASYWKKEKEKKKDPRLPRPSYSRFLGTAKMRLQEERGGGGQHLLTDSNISISVRRRKRKRKKGGGKANIPPAPASIFLCAFISIRV